MQAVRKTVCLSGRWRWAPRQEQRGVLERGAPGKGMGLRLRGCGLGQRQGGAEQRIAQRELVEQQAIGGRVACHQLNQLCKQPVVRVHAR